LGTFWSSTAWTQTKDAGLWSSFQVARAWKDFTTSASAEWRLSENLSKSESAFLETKIQYKFNKYFRVSLGYRNGIKQDQNFEYFQRQRWNIDLKLRKKFDDLSLEYRFRYQIGGEQPFLIDNLSVESNTYRHKLSVGYKINKKWTVGVGFEGFAEQNLDNRFFWTDWRVQGKAEYKLKKRNYISLGYLVQGETGGADPLQEYIFSVGYKLELKKWKKKKEPQAEKNGQ